MSQKHPRGLAIIFFTEFWERFGYYLMIAIFTLYMVAPLTDTFPGMGMNRKNAADIYGTFLALVYLTPFFGGFLADKFLGYRRSVYIGAAAMAVGYMGLAIPGNLPVFYTSLLIIVLGNGLFKPNMAALVGRLYERPEYLALKDSGFSLYYMSVNIGAFVCSFAAAWMRLRYGWGWAFATAGIGMAIGFVWFLTGNILISELKTIDKKSPPKAGEMSLMKIVVSLFVPAFVAAFLGWIIPGNLLGSDSTDAFIFFCLPVLYFYYNEWRKSDEQERRSMAALYAIYGVVIVFWAVFHQNGSALTYWTQYNTERSIGSTGEKILNVVAGVEEVSTVPRTRTEAGLHGEAGRTFVAGSYYFDNYGGTIPAGNIVSKPADLSNEEWAAVEKAKQSDYGVLKLWPTELQSSINPFFVVLLTPVVVGFFAWLRRRKKEPSTPAKIAYGMLLSSLAWVIMVFAALVSGNGADKASVWWLFGIYGVITIGELCLSPMGLSLVSKMAPKRITALMMGGWFLATSIGNKLSGVMSGMWDAFDNKAWYFATNAALTALAFVLLLILLPWLRRIYNETVETQKI